MARIESYGIGCRIVFYAFVALRGDTSGSVIVSGAPSAMERIVLRSCARCFVENGDKPSTSMNHRPSVAACTMLGALGALGAGSPGVLALPPGDHGAPHDEYFGALNTNHESEGRCLSSGRASGRYFEDWPQPLDRTAVQTVGRLVSEGSAGK
jgi:hypothetical protein